MKNSTLTPGHIADITAARAYIMDFSCPSGFSQFSWRQLQQTALAVWQSHLKGTHYRGSLHFCRPEFYAMLTQPSGQPIVSVGRIRGFMAA